MRVSDAFLHDIAEIIGDRLRRLRGARLRGRRGLELACVRIPNFKPFCADFLKVVRRQDVPRQERHPFEEVGHVSIDISSNFVSVGLEVAH